MKLHIDVRKAFDSGIGTYIQGVVGRVIKEIRSDVDVSLIVAHDRPWLPEEFEVSMTRVDMRAAPLGLKEQPEWRSLTARGEAVWATSLAHPLFSGVPLLATVHDAVQLALPAQDCKAWLVGQASRLYFESLKRSARALLFNSNFTHQEFLRLVRPGRDIPYTVTPLGVERAWFDASTDRSKVTVSEGRPYFLCFGNLKRNKNLRRLLRAFSLVMDRVPHDLHIVGQHQGFKTSDRALMHDIERLRLRVRFLGFLPVQALQTQVAQAEAMVFPSMYEGFGLPALEAMAAGCPVLAAGNSSLPEVCGTAARYFDPFSETAMADAMVAQASLALVERERMVALGKARAQGFTWEATARLTVGAIERFLNSSAA